MQQGAFARRALRCGEWIVHFVSSCGITLQYTTYYCTQTQRMALDYFLLLMMLYYRVMITVAPFLRIALYRIIRCWLEYRNCAHLCSNRNKKMALPHLLDITVNLSTVGAIMSKRAKMHRFNSNYCTVLDSTITIIPYYCHRRRRNLQTKFPAWMMLDACSASVKGAS